MNKCPRCESEILKEYNYCRICGALLDYEVKDATVEVLKSMMANYIELECKDSEDEKGRKLAIGTLGIAITELERIAQEAPVQEQYIKFDNLPTINSKEITFSGNVVD